MGIEIRARDDDGPIPRACIMTLSCDGDEHPMFAPTHMQYCTGSHMGDFSAAMADGWLERNNATGRHFLCPKCSNKKPHHPA